MQQQVAPGLQHHVRQLLLADFGIDVRRVQDHLLPGSVAPDVEVDHVRLFVFSYQGGIAAAPLIGRREVRRAAGLQTVDQLLAEASDPLFALDVPQVGDDVDQTAGRHAAQVAVALHQQHAGARAGGRYGSRRAAGAAADHDDVRLPHQGDRASADGHGPARQVFVFEFTVVRRVVDRDHAFAVFCHKDPSFLDR